MMKHFLNSFLFICLLAGCTFAVSDINDNLNSTMYLRPNINASVSYNGNGTVSMIKTATGASDVNWYDYSYIRYRRYYDKVKITPVSQIAWGQYSISVVYLNTAKQFLGEVEWAPPSSDTNVRVLQSVAGLAAEHNITAVEYYYIRFRIHGEINSGFIFDKIFVTESQGYWPQTELMQAAPKIVFVHAMTSFRTPGYTGGWDGWDEAYKKNGIQYYHYPWIKDSNGRPDIASVEYPSVGYYDMKDPALIEYHCQIMKMAGIGGIIFDLVFYSSDNEIMMQNYFNLMGQYGLKAVICFEDKGRWKWDATATTRDIALSRTYSDMNDWFDLFTNSGVQYNVIDNRPLFLMYSYEEYINAAKGVSCLLPDEITNWLNTITPENRPVLMRQNINPWFSNLNYIDVLNGVYDWPTLYGDVPPGVDPNYISYCGMTDNADKLNDDTERGQSLLVNNYADFHMSGVWPGFDDWAVWGWDQRPHLMPRFDGQLYEQCWNWAIANNLPVVQIATWNDWFECTIIEPSVKFGNFYIEKTFQKISEFKNIPNSPVPDFNVPIWIYKIRDITTDSQVLADMQTASEYIKTGQYAEASDIVSFWANFFNIDSVTYWTGPGSLTAYRPGDYSHDNKINFKDIAIIGQNWQNKYHILDLKLVADNWLDE